MINVLTIQNLLTVEKQIISFTTGLNVVTGETGTGKSILLDALQLLLGKRADFDLIRPKKEILNVTAEFTLTKELKKILYKNGFEPEEDTLLISRILYRSGKSKLSLNHTPVSLNFINTIAPYLLSIQNQSEQNTLLSPKAHTQLIDRYGQYDSLLDEVSNTYLRWHKATHIHQENEQIFLQAKTQANFQKEAITELSALSPQSMEEDTILNERNHLKNAQNILNQYATILEQFNEPKGILERMRKIYKATDRLKEATPKDSLFLLDNFSKNMEQFLDIIIDAKKSLELNENQLPELDERLFQLRNIARKYNTSANHLDETLQNYTKKLNNFTILIDTLKQSKKIVQDTHEQYLACVNQLTTERTKTIKKLTDTLLEEFPPLKLNNTQLHITLEEVEPGENGINRVVILLSFNPSIPMGLLHKIASGGELSRFLLAFKSALAKNQEQTTLIFDEIDAGVGGAVGTAVGRKLKSLAQYNQIIAITHSPQVTAFANQHILLKKYTELNNTYTESVILSMEQRIEEIARMLSDDHITSEAKMQAKRLLEHNIT